MAFVLVACEPPFVEGSTTPTPEVPDEEVETPDTGEAEQPAVKPEKSSGITLDPALPNADEPCKILFNPSSSNKLYNHKGELYAHLGIVVEGEWMFVPAGWDQNIEKCHFKKVSDNSWEL